MTQQEIEVFLTVARLSTYLLPPVFREFLALPGRTLTFHHYHSREAYDYIAQGLADIALISDHMYHPQVETVPAFCYIKYAVISADPEGDAIGRVRSGPRPSTPPNWTRPRSCACPGTRSTTCGTPSGSARRPSPGRCWTRCRCWRSSSPGREAGGTAGPSLPPLWPSPCPGSWG